MVYTSDLRPKKCRDFPIALDCAGLDFRAECLWVRENWEQVFNNIYSLHTDELKKFPDPALTLTIGLLPYNPND